MSERMVPTPVSLIEDARELVSACLTGSARMYVPDDLVDRLRQGLDALHAQQTPPAEHVEDWTDAQPNEGPGCTCGFNGSFEECAAWRAAEAAEPLRIDDMAPGTTFWARHVQGVGLDGREVQWVVEAKNDAYGPLVESETGTWRYTTVDPSTIRDVTPPPTTPAEPSERFAEAVAATVGDPGASMFDALEAAALPRIDDMAPGERFCNNSADHSTHRWFPAPFDSKFGDVHYTCPGRIDPSTIRDSTPPPTTEETR